MKPITPGGGLLAGGRGPLTHGGGAMVKRIKRVILGVFAAATVSGIGCMPLNQYASDPVVRMD